MRSPMPGAGLVLAGVTAVLLAPMAILGPAVGHDSGFHAQWAEHFTLALREGCWYPRWLRAVNNGFGSPTFVFYPPAFHYAVAGVMAMGTGIVTALWLVSGAALWASGVSMALFLRRPFGSAAALAGSLAYVLAPYRILDLYERAALPESAAFVWPPLILAAVDRADAETARVWLAIASLATAGLVFTHHAMLAMFLPLILAYCVLRHRPGDAVRSIGFVILGLGIGALSLLPATGERENVFWITPRFAHAFLFSASDHIGGRFAHTLERDALFYAVAAGLGLVVAVRARRRTTALFAAALAASLVVACAVSAPLWRALPILQQIDLPWRWLAVGTFAFAAITAAAVQRGGVLGAAALAVVLGGACTGAYDWIVPAKYDAGGARTPPAGVAWNDARALRPRWAPWESLPRIEGPVVTSGHANFAEISCHRQVFETVAQRDATMRIDVFYYPSWTASVDGVPARLWPERRKGRIELRIPRGRHRVAFEFRRSTARATAAWVSAISLGLLVLACVRGGHRGARG